MRFHGPFQTHINELFAHPNGQGGPYAHFFRHFFGRLHQFLIREDETEKENLELREYRRLWLRAIVAGAIGATMFTTGMGGLMPSIEQGQVAWLFVSFITLLVLVFAGGHFFTGAWKALLELTQSVSPVSPETATTTPALSPGL